MGPGGLPGLQNRVGGGQLPSPVGPIPTRSRHCIPAGMHSNWYNSAMLLRLSRFVSVCMGTLFGALLLALPAACSTAAQPVAQRHINELAAALLRAHRTLIEEAGLRRDGEHLDAYMGRIALPLPSESDARYRAREESYVSALERAGAASLTCTSVPVLRDTSAANIGIWNQVVKATVRLPNETARVRVAWTACRHSSSVHSGAKRLGNEMTRTMLVIKTAYDALREAHP